jgi:hypothetical protein
VRWEAKNSYANGAEDFAAPVASLVDVGAVRSQKLTAPRFTEPHAKPLFLTARLSRTDVVTFVVTLRSDAHIQLHPATPVEREQFLIFLKDGLQLVERFGRGARI